jgi:hypothetical protein
MSRQFTVTRLEAKVEAVNAGSKYALELYDELRKVFIGLIGQQIDKADGTLRANVQKLMPQLPNSNKLRVYRYHSDYSLIFTVAADADCEFEVGTNYHSSERHEISVYIGHLSNGKLTGLYDRPEGLRDNWTVAEVEANRKAYEDAKKAADAAKNKLFHFGEHDR